MQLNSLPSKQELTRGMLCCAMLLAQEFRPTRTYFNLAHDDWESTACSTCKHVLQAKTSLSCAQATLASHVKS